MYIPHSIGVIISVSQKCASTSISNQFHVEGIRPITETAVVALRESFWRVIGIVRDPIDRFESAYNFFKYGQCGKFPEDRKFNCIEDFTDAVLNGFADVHWSPQAEVLGLCDKYADLESFPLEIHENSCKHKEIALHRRHELEQYYSDDYSIRGSVWPL